MNEIEITIEDGGWPALCADAGAIAVRAAHAALEDHAAAPRQSIELSIVLASDERLRALNRAYRGIDKPTNVLSFAAEAEARAGDQTPRLLGDVIMARQTVAREARSSGLPVADHLSHLVVHGVLHLLGFDHEIEADARKMQACEAMILARLGIADPYARPDTRGARRG